MIQSSNNRSSSTSEEIKARLSSLTSEELKALQDIYHDRWRRNWLQSIGWLNVFLGGLTLWAGLSGLSVFSFPRLIQAVLGVLIVGQSLWAILRPSTAAFLRFAIVFLAAGIWNTLLGFRGSFVGAAFLIGLLGMAQLWWAFQINREYQRFQQLGLSVPPTDLVRFYDAVWQAMTRGVLKNDSAGIRVWIGSSIARWQGLILADRIIFAFRGRRLLVIQSRDAANFMPNGSNPMRKKRVYGRIKLNARFERAMMKHDSFEKYARWKDEANLLSDAPPSLWQRLPQALRVVVKIAGILSLLVIIIVIISTIGLIIQYS